MSYHIEEFFKIHSLATGAKFTSGKEYKDEGSNSLSVDGSGEVPSVNDKNSPHIAKYILDKGYERVLDIGAGLGYLQWGAEQVGLDCYSLEGSARLSPHVVCDKSKYCIYDITKGVDTRLCTGFDLTTSFEVIEHIHRDERDAFWDNLEKIACSHIGSIHVTGGEHALHKTVELPAKWMDYFNKRGYLYRILHWFPHTNDLSLQSAWNLCGWDCSIIMEICF